MGAERSAVHQQRRSRAKEIRALAQRAERVRRAAQVRGWARNLNNRLRGAFADGGADGRTPVDAEKMSQDALGEGEEMPSQRECWGWG